MCQTKSSFPLTVRVNARAPKNHDHSLTQRASRNTPRSKFHLEDTPCTCPPSTPATGPRWAPLAAADVEATRAVVVLDAGRAHVGGLPAGGLRQAPLLPRLALGGGNAVGAAAPCLRTTQPATEKPGERRAMEPGRQVEAPRPKPKQTLQRRKGKVGSTLKRPQSEAIRNNGDRFQLRTSFQTIT